MYRAFVLSLIALLLIIRSGSCLAVETASVFNVDRDRFPFYPSLLRWVPTQAPFTPPEVCGGCHPDQYSEWTGSIHALAFVDPVYQGELNKAVKAAGHEVAKQCEGCHSAAGVVTGEVKGPGVTGLSDMALAGVSCDICHSVSAVTPCETPTREPENGSMVLAPGYDSVDGGVLVKRGPFPPSEECGGGFHECRESPLHLQADLCAACHQVYHYEKHFPLEATYLEWKHGPYAQNGILCQDCHMVEIDTFLKTADQFRKPERGEYRHYFNGANYLLYYLARGAAIKAGVPDLAASLQKKYEMAVARLQAAAALEIAPVYEAGSLVEFRVRVKNQRAGHNLPTSLTNVRQMWLEVTARDASGRVLMSSGSPDKDGALPANARLFNSDGMGDNFHFAIDPWVVTAFSRHDTIPPRGYRDVWYRAPVVPDARPLSLEVRLRYRQADQKVAEALLKAVPKDIDLAATYGLEAIPSLPIVDMVVEQVQLPTHSP